MSIDDVTPQEWDRASAKIARMAREEADEMVEQPPHYNYGKIECIEAIEESMTPEAFNGYLKGNTLKYLWRYERKGNALQDLKKAQWYLDRLIDEVNE